MVYYDAVFIAVYGVLSIGVLLSVMATIMLCKVKI